MKNLYLSLDFLIRKILLSATNGNIKSFVKRVVWFLLVYTRIFLATIIVKVNKKFGLPFRFNKVVYIPDVFLVSYPKAGRTWVRVMLAKISYHLGGDPTKLEIIRYTHDGSDFVSDGNLSDCGTFNFSKWKKCKVILLVRDPRDIVVSSFYQVKKRNPEIYRFKGDISKFVRSPQFGITRVISFYNCWYKHRNAPRKLLLVRYEDLKNDTQKEVLRICKFLNISTPGLNKKVKDAVEYGKFENMRSMEVGGINVLSDKKALLPVKLSNTNTYKTRKGLIGDYKKELSKKDIEYVDNSMKKLVNYYGYKTS